MLINQPYLSEKSQGELMKLRAATMRYGHTLHAHVAYEAQARDIKAKLLADDEACDPSIGLWIDTECGKIISETWLVWRKL